MTRQAGRSIRSGRKYLNLNPSTAEQTHPSISLFQLSSAASLFDLFVVIILHPIMKDPCTTTSGTWPVFVQSFPPKSEFNADQIPDQSGRVVLVTGTFTSPQVAAPLSVHGTHHVFRGKHGHRVRNHQGPTPPLHRINLQQYRSRLYRKC